MTISVHVDIPTEGDADVPTCRHAGPTRRHAEGGLGATCDMRTSRHVGHAEHAGRRAR
jgi:hypothetical protein